MRVNLGIPFSSTEPTRIAAFDKAMEELEGLTRWHHIQVHGFLVKPFNRGKARNELVDILAPDSDVIVLCDADSYPQREPLMRAILGAAFDGKIHNPFDIVHQVDKDGNLAYTYASTGGCYVFRPDAWSRIGGMEERGGWSVDDRAFLEVIKSFNAGPISHPGALTVLWHARDESCKLTPESTRIINEYLAIGRDPEKMREYLRGIGRMA